MGWVDITDKQWKIIEALLPIDPVRADKRGRPWSERRAVLNGILWVLRTGAPWHDLPDRYPPYQTVHRRFGAWNRTGVMRRLLQTLAEDLRLRGKIDIRECFIDGTFVGAKKGGLPLALPSGARAARSWPLQTLMVFLSPYCQRALRLVK
jgi:transposase